MCKQTWKWASWIITPKVVLFLVWDWIWMLFFAFWPKECIYVARLTEATPLTAQGF